MQERMHKFISLADLIVIGVLTWSTVVSSNPLGAKKSEFHPIIENNWPDPDPNINRFPHQTSCHYFYHVLSEEDISIRKCPDGKLFDYFVHKCVEKVSARCWSRHFSDINHDHNLMHKAPKKFRCPYAYGKYPDITDCSRYYQCLSGKAKKKKCAPFEFFDKIKRKCMAEIHAVCADETDVVEHGYKCPRTWGSFSFSKDCSKYYECLEKRPDLRTCAKHTLFDEKKRQCISSENVRCGSRHNPYEMETTPSLPTSISVAIEETAVEITEHQKDTSQTFQYPQNSNKPSNEFESSSITPSKLDDKDSEVIDLITADYDSSENDISKESTEDSKEIRVVSTKKDFSKEPSESTEDINEDFSKESTESTADIKKDFSKESTESTEDINKDFSKEPKESSKNSKESSEDIIKETSKESKEDSLKYISMEPTVNSHRESSVISTKFISTVEIIPSEEHSTAVETVTASEELNWAVINPITKGTEVCHPKDLKCIQLKDRIIRCPEANGYFPHPEDERHFFHCVNFKIFIKPCPGNLVFKDSLKACAWSLDMAKKNG